LSAGVLLVFGLGPSLKVAGNFVWKDGTTPVSWLPYRLLLAVPGLGALRAPVRVEYVLVAVLVAATAIALQRIVDAAPGRLWLVGVIAGVLLATNLLVPLPTTDTTTTAASRAALHRIATTAEPGDTVLGVPADCDPSFVSLQRFHHAPVVGCAGSFAANPWSKLRTIANHPAVAKLRCDRATYGRLESETPNEGSLTSADLEGLRRDLGVRFLVVDRSKLGAACDAVTAAVPLLEQFRSLGGDGRYDVVDLDQRAAS
jgi:hypothetical protein